MKLFHISDLHLGKQLHGYSLIGEQRDLLRQVVEQAEKERPDVLLVCGDIYDRSIPSGEAVRLFDEFLVALDGLSYPLPVLIIAGNHDSPERLRYGTEFLRAHRIYISVLPPQSSEERLEKVVLEDSHGVVNFYLLPFLRPGMVRHYMPDEAAKGEETVIRELLSREKINEAERNVLLSHQFYVHGNKEPLQCDSEQARIYVGGLDAIDVRVLSPFDYVALGHIHSCQKIGPGEVHYCGTPMPYSVSEAGQEKAITVVEIGEKGEEIQFRRIPFEQKRWVRKIQGGMKELIAQAEEFGRDFVSITYTDEEVPEQLRQQLEPYYNAILEIRVDNTRSRHLFRESEETAPFAMYSPEEMFGHFFEDTQGRALTEDEKEVFRDIIHAVIGGNE